MGKLRSLILILFVAVFITACGAGGGDTNSNNPDASDTTKPTVSQTSPANGATGVAINSAISVTFSEAVDSTSVNASTFQVSGISGTVSVNGTTATFTPSSNLSYNTPYTVTLTTGIKDAAGNAMDANYTCSFTTGALADTTPPTVSSVSPANNATDMAVNASVTATFSETMDASTINSTTFTMIQGTTPVSGTVTYSGTTATFTPSSNLAYSTTYTATITTGVKDAAGNAMVANYSWSFTTGAAPDTTPPTVSSTSPTNNATGIAINSAITATFSEIMDASSITTSTFYMGGVSGTVTYNGTTATFTPSSNLNYDTAYTVTITTTVKDAAGNAMANTYSWSFTTGTTPDTTPPTVSSASPTNNATGVGINSAITATFSETMDSSTVTTSTFTLKQGTTAIDGTVTYNGSTATFTPSSNLSYSTTYTATITTGVKDSAGNAMTSNYSWSFTTGTVPDTTPPTVSSTSPTGGAVAVNSSITATFSETMDSSSVTTSTFTLKQGTTAIAGTIAYTGTTATFTPSNNLAYSTTYTATITTGVKDAAGNAMAAAYTWTFTTGSAIPGANFKMPDTGQTTSYTSTFGEDHDYTINPPSYIDSGNGTITDNVTGLVWQKQDDATKRTWDNAVTYCSNLSLGGQTDWRLPSLIEVISIMDYGVYNPPINTTFFPGTQSSHYWSSTIYSNATSYAWFVDFSNGYSDATMNWIGERYVRCVRGGQ